MGGWWVVVVKVNDHVGVYKFVLTLKLIKMQFIFPLYLAKASYLTTLLNILLFEFEIGKVLIPMCFKNYVILFVLTSAAFKLLILVEFSKKNLCSQQQWFIRYSFTSFIILFHNFINIP